MKLPEEFLERMGSLMEMEEYNDFLKSYSFPRHYGLRVNSLKCDIGKFKKIAPFNIKPINWTSDGFYYPEGVNPGKHPYYYAGIYYIQEPSAMFPAEVFDAKPGEKVLDLCAAPGGKTVKIAASMKGKGLLVSNDISSSRVKALVKNIELYGIKNAVVTIENPQRLAANFNLYFDRILVDAPCSGEGMFRKDDASIKSWQKFKCEKCTSMQKGILDSAHRMLKPGGSLLYSTCTFAPEENEIQIKNFLENYRCYELQKILAVNGIEEGRPKWCDGYEDIKKTVRLWPHRLDGEGHFTALLRKKGTISNSSLSYEDSLKAPDALKGFCLDNLNMDIPDGIIQKGSSIYGLPLKLPSMDGLKVAKFGWYLGEIKSKRFEPSHAMVMALDKKDIVNTIDFSSDSKEIARYLKGETIILDKEYDKGLYAICVDGYTVGWSKVERRMLKNLYPKGWRKMN